MLNPSGQTKKQFLPGAKFGKPNSLFKARMDTYYHDYHGSAEDFPISEEERRERLSYFEQILNASGIALTGSILDLASGTTSLAYLCPDVVAVDSNPQKIRRLCQDNITAIIADVNDLPFRDNSFDYVVSISPPLMPLIIHKNGLVIFNIDREYSRKIVDAALKIAREKVLIASYDIALHPPHEDLIEKRENGEHNYVVYNANGNSN